MIQHKYSNTHSLKRPNGVRFIATASTAEFANRWNPQAGDIVTFKHRGFLQYSGRPKLPSIYRLRTDITWDTVIQNFKENTRPPTSNKPPRTSLSPLSLLSPLSPLSLSLSLSLSLFVTLSLALSFSHVSYQFVPL